MAISALGVGSGLDLTGLLSQLEAAERSSLTPLNQQQRRFESQISAFGQLRGAISGFQTASEKLVSTDFFRSTTSSVSGDSVTAAASPSAVPGQYNVTVNNLATRYSIATDGIADKESNLGAATIVIDQANGDSLSVDVAFSESSLEEIADAINAAEGGVQASIVNDGSGTPYRLAITSKESGADAAISNIDFGALNGTLNTDAATEVLGVDASLTVNGIAISSASNQVSDAIEGLTLSLAETGDSIVTVDRDVDSIKEGIKGFVEAYNSLGGRVDSLGFYSAGSGNSGPLQGNSTLRGVEQQLRSAMNSAVTGSDYSLIGDIGLSFTLEGKLEIDDEQLDAIIETNLDDLEKFFGGVDGEGGLVGALTGVFDATIGEDGSIAAAETGLESSVDRIKDSKLRMEDQIADTIERYRRDFARLDSAVASMTATGDFLGQQLSMLNAQFTSK